MKKDIIVIDNPRVVEKLQEKEALVLEGRKKMKALEKLEKKLTKLKEIERTHSGKCVPKELMEQGNAIVAQVNALADQLKPIQEAIHQAKLDAIPEPIKAEHIKLAKEKEALEKELNKIGLNVEKLKSRYKPLIRKLALPYLSDEYEDLETAFLSKQDGKHVVHIKKFSHLEVWKERFLKNKRETPVL